MIQIQLTDEARQCKSKIEAEMRKRGYKMRGSYQDVINYALVNLSEVITHLDKNDLDNLLNDPK